MLDYGIRFILYAIIQPGIYEIIDNEATTILITPQT
jgi:hypothetical protein